MTREELIEGGPGMRLRLVQRQDPPKKKKKLSRAVVARAITKYNQSVDPAGLGIKVPYYDNPNWSPVREGINMTREELIEAILESVSTRSTGTLRDLISKRVDYPEYKPGKHDSVIKLPPHEARNALGQNDSIRASRHVALTYGGRSDAKAKLARGVVDNIQASIASRFKWPNPQDSVLPSDMKKALARRKRKSR